MQAKCTHATPKWALATPRNAVRTHKWALAAQKCTVWTLGGAKDQRVANSNARRIVQAKSKHATPKWALAALKNTVRTHRQHPIATFGVQYASRHVRAPKGLWLTKRQASGPVSSPKGKLWALQHHYERHSTNARVVSSKLGLSSLQHPPYIYREHL